MEITGESRIREILQSCPHADAIFDTLGLAYFGHDRSLAEACNDAKISVDAVRRQLQQDCDEEKADEQRDWEKAPLLELTEYIVHRHHAFAKESIEGLTRLFDPLFEVHKGHGTAIVKLRALFESFKEPFIRHLLEEEQVLFPYIERLEEAGHTDAPIQPPYFGTLSEPAKNTVLQHGESIVTLQQLLSLGSSESLPSDCHDALEEFFEETARLISDLARHIELENTILLPRALMLESAVASRFSILGELW